MKVSKEVAIDICKIYGPDPYKLIHDYAGGGKKPYWKYFEDIDEEVIIFLIYLIKISGFGK